MKDAESLVKKALEEFVRRRRDGGKATEWFFCSAEIGRKAVIKACCDINTKHLSSPRAHTERFVREIMVGQYPEEEYTQRPGDANEGFAVTKVRLGNHK